MFCRNCGTRLNDGAKFCGKCGLAPPVNPSFPCKVIVFNIKNALFGLKDFEKRPLYEAARKYWKETAQSAISFVCLR
jgi:hypothetical protein